MPRLDVYIKNLVNHSAKGITLAADQMVTLHFEDGTSRAMKKQSSTEEIMTLMQEVMDPATTLLFQRAGKVTFGHTADAFGVVTVALDRTGGVLRVDITRGEPPPSSPGPSVQAPAEPQPAAALTAEPQPATEPRIHALLRLMAKRNASDLHLHADEVPAARVSGGIVSLGGDRMQAPVLMEMMLELLNAAQRAAFERDHDLDFAHNVPGVGRFRINGLRDRRGPGLVARLIPEKILSLEELGTPPALKTLASLTRGLVLVTGPSGSGRSTTLAAMVDHVNRTREDHILTVEAPIEFVHRNRKSLVTQREVGTHTRTYASALRAALREDPNVILVGDLRDVETLSLAIETAESGHLVLGSLNTSTAAATVDRVVEGFPADRQAQVRSMLANSLKGVVAQVLCKRVGGGRVAAHEVMLGATSVANLIREGKTYQLDSAIQMGRKEGMQTLNDSLVALVQKKVIEPAEAYQRSLQRAEMKTQLARLGWSPPPELEALGP
jgi:twitching motility protein PilT